MRRMFVISLFILATLVWAAAQQPGNMPERSGGQATPQSSQTPDASQQQSSTPQAGSEGQAANAPKVVEGCLGGSNPNFTITDKAGTTYKLNLPANADASTLTPHIGESVQVSGDMREAGKSASIDVNRIGRGTGTCPSSSSSGTPPPPKQ